MVSLQSILGTKKLKATKLVNLIEQLKGIPSRTCKIKRKGPYSQYFQPEDIDVIRSYGLDFILHLDFNILRGDILNAAKYGVWAFHHGDEMKYRGIPTGFWELYFSEKTSAATLQQLSEKLNAGIVLKKGYLKTQVTYVKNRDLLLFESAKWPKLLAKKIQLGQTEIFEQAPSLTSAPIRTIPTNSQMINYGIKSFFRLAKKVWRSYFFTDFWNIAVVEAPINSFLKPQLPKATWFPKLPKSKFLADPFALFYNDKLHIIYEVFPYQTGLGEIAALEYKHGLYKDNGHVITEPFHMSYPYLIQFDKQIYCIPETWESNQVRLYKAVEFPLKWELDRVMIDNYAGIDNTPLYHNDYWWLFSTDKENGAHFNLNLFYTKDFFGGWQAHPLNPIKTDIRSARPAGTIFSEQGEIYRPAMDYSEKVEGRIIINRITKISTTEFEEEVHNIINPYRDTYFSDKIHTLGACGPYTVIDGAKELFIFSSWSAFRYKMKSKFGRK